MVIEVRNKDCPVFPEGTLGPTMKSMFDIFTTAADGSLHLVESVSCLRKAEDLARRLSSLFPGEYFGCFERSEEAPQPVPRAEGRKSDLPNLGVSSVAFLV
jgi:hypothetical protein